MNNYKININRTPPTPEDIARLRNFDEVLGSINGAIKPLYLRLWFVSAAAATVIIGLVGSVILLTHPENSKLSDRPFINPAPITIQNETYTVNCDDSTGIITPSGSIIQIPKGSLVDQNGKVVSGVVDVQYREFRDPVDFMCSGIPMTYDSAGTNYFFESGGMFEINASQNKASLQVNPEKNMTVRMSTPYNPEQYNQYYLDTVQKQWIYKGKDHGQKDEQNLAMVDSCTSNESSTSVNIPKTRDHATSSAVQKCEEEVKKAEAKKEAITKEVVALKSARPVAPVKANPKITHFNFGYDKKDFPELAVYNNILFDVGAENKDFKESYYATTWEKVTMEDGPKKGVNYKMTLSRRNQNVVLIVYPVFEGKNYDSAKVAYSKIVKDYQSKVSTKEKEQEAAVAEAKASMERMRLEAEKNEKAVNEQIANNKKAYEAQQKEARLNAIKMEEERLANMTNAQKFWHVVSVSQMGVWNNDCPRRFKNEATIYTTCVSEDEKSIQPMGDVYLIDKKLNACIGYHPSGVNTYNISYDKGADNVLVTFDAGKFYIIGVTEFKEQFKGGERKQAKFRPQLNVSTVEEIRQILAQTN